MRADLVNWLLILSAAIGAMFSLAFLLDADEGISFFGPSKPDAGAKPQEPVLYSKSA